MIANLLIAAALNAAAPGIQTADVPRCSATVTDECMEAGTPAHRAKVVHHRKKHHSRAK